MKETTANTASPGHAGEVGAGRRPAHILESRPSAYDDEGFNEAIIHPSKKRKGPGPFWSPQNLFTVVVFTLVVLVSANFFVLASSILATPSAMLAEMFAPPVSLRCLPIARPSHFLFVFYRSITLPGQERELLLLLAHDH